MLFALLQLIASGAHVHVSAVAAASAFGYALPLFVSLKMHCTEKVNASKSHTISICANYIVSTVAVEWSALHAAVCIAESQRVNWADMTVRNAFSPTFVQFNFHLFLLAHVAYAICLCAPIKPTPHSQGLHLQSHTDFAISGFFSLLRSERECVRKPVRNQCIYFERLWHFRKRKLRSIGNEFEGITERAPYSRIQECSHFDCCHDGKRELNDLAPHA